MGASKPKPSSGAPAFKLARLLLRQPYRSLLLTAMVVIACAGGAVYAWQRWGEPATPEAAYLVSAEAIHVTSQPAWIQADVKGEVVRTANLTRLDVRDRKLVENVASAFALHPWVAAVERVEKRFPPAVDVQLRYRRPVAVVEIAARGEAGLLFIDAHSVLLPSADFAPERAKDFLRIAGGNETPTGMYGTTWGSERIAGAARLAAAWGERWKPLLLYRIVPLETPGGGWHYELESKAGARIAWGAAPGKEPAGEPLAEQKIATLEQHVADTGPLDDRASGTPLDLRGLGLESRAGKQGDRRPIP
jgi:hypothetical protein